MTSTDYVKILLIVSSYELQCELMYTWLLESVTNILSWGNSFIQKY